MNCFLHPKVAQDTNPKQVIPKSVIARRGNRCDTGKATSAAMPSLDTAKAVSPQQPGRKSLRILCAEDDSYVSQIVKYAFEQQGHFVECVEDGETALQRITSDLKFFDVLVTDHQMPRLSGLGLVSKLRDTEFSGLIVVHSSHLTEAEASAYRALAVDHIMSKPAPLPGLLSALHCFERMP